MTISITKKLALGILVTGVTFSGLSSSVLSMEGIEFSSQPGVPLSSMDNRANETLRDFLSGMTTLQTAHVAVDVSNSKNESLDALEDIYGIMPGVLSVEDVTPELKEKARILRRLGFRLDDPEANHTYNLIIKDPNYATAPDFKASEERRTALIQAAHDRRMAGQWYDYADVQHHADVVQSGCPVTAQTLNAKARFEDWGHYHHIYMWSTEVNQQGADYYAAAALELAGHNDPMFAEYSIVRLVASAILKKPVLSKLPPSADIARHTLRLWPDGAKERLALYSNDNLLEEFAEEIAKLLI